MFKRDLDSMRRGVKVAMEMKRCPPEMFIKKRAAEYVQCPYYHGSIHKEIFDNLKPSNFKMPPSGRTEPLVCVKVVDLFVALQNARGVDEDVGDWRSRDSNEDHDQTCESTEDKTWDGPSGSIE